MRHYLLGLLLLSFSFCQSANLNDSIHYFSKEVKYLNEEVKSLNRENEQLKKDCSNLKLFSDSTIQIVDSLKKEVKFLNDKICSLADSINIDLSSTREQIQSSSTSLNKSIDDKSRAGMWIFIGLAIILAAIAFIFGILIYRRRNEVASLSAKADKINEEIVNRMSAEMNEMQSISKQIASLSNVSGGNTDSEQALIKTLADRITFMEMTLYKMDSSVRGHKQLSRSIKQMKDNLLANGYELVDMLGKPYHEGMKVTANFVEDDKLADGQQIITGIIKPQINYKGKMIQPAQITVSRN